MKSIKFFLKIIILICLTACANSSVSEFNAWKATELPRAEKGEIKWSDFYKEGFARIEKAPNHISNKASSMERHNLMIQAALLFEQGVLSKEQFDYMRRAEAAEIAAEEQAHNIATSKALGQALKNYGDARYAPSATKSQIVPAPIYQPPKQLRCVTNNNVTSCQEY